MSNSGQRSEKGTNMQQSKSTLNTLALLGALVTGGMLLPRFAQAQATLSPREIMEKVMTTRKLDGSEASAKLTIIDEKGQKQEKEFTSATKVFDGGKTEKRVFRFLAPAEVKGMGILIFDYDTKADDMWVFMPAMRKSRRIMSSAGSQSFMGSEFSNADINVPPLDDYDHTLVKEEACAGGETCYVVETVPKTQEIAKAEGYAKKTWFVSKTKFVALRCLFYGQDGKLFKELIASDVKLLDSKKKRYRIMRMEMINKQNGRRSIFESTKMNFAPNTKDEYFTTSYIERG
jgi:hypothetical protein